MGNPTFGRFTWPIKNFSKLGTNVVYSDTFVVGGYPWRTIMFPRGNNAECLSIYLAAANTANLPRKWSIYATFKFTIFDQINIDNSLIRGRKHTFNARESSQGFKYAVPLYLFHHPWRGFLVNDTCIIGVEVSVPDSRHDNQVKQDLKSVPPIPKQVCTAPTEHKKEMMATPNGDLVDFRGFGKIDKAYVPLLEEVCSQHPSLTECQQNRSLRFTEWAFTALGRVLHFLETKKVKDMNENSCNELKMVWEELETCEFNLTWLEPHVESALDKGSHVDRATHVEELRKKVEALGWQMKGLKVNLAYTELSLDLAREKLKTEEGLLRGINLDAELGYGKKFRYSLFPKKTHCYYHEKC